MDVSLPTTRRTSAIAAAGQGLGLVPVVEWTGVRAGGVRIRSGGVRCGGGCRVHAGCRAGARTSPDAEKKEAERSHYVCP